LNALLAEYGFRCDDIVKESVFLRNIEDQAPCGQFLFQYYGGALPVTNYIKEPPGEGELLVVEIMAIRGEQVRVRKISEHLAVVQESGCRWAYVGGIEPPADIQDTFVQALDCFAQMRDQLAAAGFHFGQVVRTWIYERDIVAVERGSSGEAKQRYQILNDARRRFFMTGNFGRAFTFAENLPPASTGIGMSSGSFVMECMALDASDSQITVQPLTNPEQVDAHDYSAHVLEPGELAGRSAPMFSRGMSIRNDYGMNLISGTAAIKGQQTVCLGDIAGQTRTTLENIALVLAQAKSTLQDVQQMRIYIKNGVSPEDLQHRVDTARRIVEETVPGIPKHYLLADVCRDNLLIEIEALSFVRK
jgi:enamine deaminase RidA (YjgF/YER057c/UK114 family)